MTESTLAAAALESLGAMVRSLLTPYAERLEHASHAQLLPELLAQWALEGLAGLGLVSLLLWLGRRCRHALSRLQQRLLERQRAEPGGGANPNLLRGLFWLLKPNATWLILLLGSRQLAPWLDDHLVLGRLPAVATLLALYLAARVFREWWMARLFMRSGQFLSPADSEALALNSRHFAALVTTAGLVGLLLQSAAPQHLPAAATLGLVLLWLISLRHWWKWRDIVARFLRRLLPAAWGEWLESRLRRPAALVLLPPLVILGQLADLGLSLHERLLQVDTYRRWATRLLRLRLESTATEPEEEPGQEVSQSYAHWFLECSAEDSGILRQSELLSVLLPPLQRWCQQKRADNVMLVVGHQGMGKSTALDLIAREWQDTPVLRLSGRERLMTPAAVHAALGGALGIDALNGTAALVAADAAGPRRVLLVDELERFHVSEVGGLDGMRTLLDYVNAPLENLFWIIAVHRPAWDYLSRVFRREQRFQDIVNLPGWSAADIRKLILSRHHRSGFQLHFDDLLLAARATSDAANFRAAESRVFSLLWEQSNGNPQQALHLWLDSAQKRRRRGVEIGLPVRPSTSPLGSLSDDASFVYAAIVRHKQLQEASILAATNLSAAIVGHALKLGLRLGLLEEVNGLGYRITPLWYPSLVTHLNRKNMLHG